MPTELSDHAALAQAFEPCTITGLAAELWKLNVEIGQIRRERDAIKTILLEWSRKEIDGPAEGQMVGRLIEGDRPCRAVQKLDEVINGIPRWKWDLEFLRKE